MSPSVYIIMSHKWLDSDANLIVKPSDVKAEVVANRTCGFEVEWYHRALSAVRPGTWQVPTTVPVGRVYLHDHVYVHTWLHNAYAATHVNTMPTYMHDRPRYMLHTYMHLYCSKHVWLCTKQVRMSVYPVYSYVIMYVLCTAVCVRIMSCMHTNSTLSIMHVLCTIL